MTDVDPVNKYVNSRYLVTMTHFIFHSIITLGNGFRRRSSSSYAKDVTDVITRSSFLNFKRFTDRRELRDLMLVLTNLATLIFQK